MDVDSKVLGLNLKYLRDMSGIQQKVVAKTVGISPATLGLYERGFGGISLSTAARLADYYKVDIEDLFSPVFTTEH